MGALFSTVLVVIAHTPIWVWPLYALLLLLGVQRTRDGSVPVWRVLVLPVVTLGLSIATVVGGGLVVVPSLSLGLVIGSFVGWQLEHEGDTRRLANGSVWLRGEWWSLAQIVAVLIYRYFTNAMSAMNPTINADPTWHLVVPLISAALSGLFVGRTMARLRVFISATRAIVP